MDLSTKVAFLLRRAFPSPPEAIETHMSWVFLTPERAYKLKKPVQYPFFDHRTVAARRADCEAEVELNQALAPGVYLRTVPLTWESDAGLALDGGGEVVDWLVVMRRLPREAMLDQRLMAGTDTVKASEVRALARRLGDFYAAGAAPLTPVALRDGLAAILGADRDELLSHDHALDKSWIRDLTARLQRLVETVPELDQRAGRVVDGHGDLRPEHVILGDEPLVIDRITFDRGLRLLDPVCDLALLTVECELLDNPQLGYDVEAAYEAVSADPVPRTTLALYRSLRATTRARLSVAHLTDSDRDAGKWLDRTDAYLDIAGRHLQLATAGRG